MRGMHSPEEREVCNALVHRLHRELKHSDIRGMVDSLRQNHAHPTVLAAAKLMHCTACQESARMLSRRTAPRQELLGNVSASEARQMLQESWFKFYGRPETVMTDPEGCFRERLFRERLASKNVKWDPQPAEAAWRIGILDKVPDVLKNAATRAARRAPEDTSCEALFDDCTQNHNELHCRRGLPFQLLIGRSPPRLPLDGDKQLGEVSASLTSDGRHRLHIQRECYRAYLDEEMSLQQNDASCTSQDPFVCGHLENGVGFGVRERICIDEPRPVDSSEKVLSWVQRGYFCKNGNEREMTSDTKLYCGSWMETSWYVVPQLISVRCRRRNKHCVR